jgi:hypothetical protein
VLDWHEPRVLAVELEQVGRVEHCGGVVPVSADEDETARPLSFAVLQAKEWGRSAFAPLIAGSPTHSTGTPFVLSTAIISSMRLE